MNPYVRVAYSASTFAWIPFAKRFERLFSPLQRIITYFASLPRYNYRRTEKEGEVYADRMWVSNTKSKEAGDKSWVNGVGRDTGLRMGVEKRATIWSGGKSKAEWRKEGHYEDYERVGTRGGYCGVRQLLVLKKEGDKSEGNWDNLIAMVPPLDI